MQIFNNFLITTKWCDCGWIDWAAFVSKVIVLISSKKLNIQKSVKICFAHFCQQGD